MTREETTKGETTEGMHPKITTIGRKEDQVGDLIRTPQEQEAEKIADQPTEGTTITKAQADITRREMVIVRLAQDTCQDQDRNQDKTREATKDTTQGLDTIQVQGQDLVAAQGSNTTKNQKWRIESRMKLTKN